MSEQIRLMALAGTCLVVASLGGKATAGGSDVGNGASVEGWADQAGTDACSAAVAELLAAGSGASTDLPHTTASAPAPFSACFDPEHPPSAEMMSRVNEFMIQGWLAQGTANGAFGERYQGTSRWSGTGFGTTGDPINLTWSIVPDGLSISGGIGEPASASAMFAKWDSRTTRAAWLSLVQQCFDRWQVLTGVNYTRVTAAGVDWDDGASWGSGNSATRGHVRISMHSIDGQGGVLAYNQFPNNGDMVLDGDDAVSTVNLFSSGNNFRFFRNVVMHEHGHGIGMSHVCASNTNQLMEPFISTAFDGPQQDEIRGGQRRYGDPNEPDNSLATAVFAGDLSVGNTITLGNVPASNGLTPASSSLLSIDGNGEVDYHRVNALAIELANITITPIGSTYNEGPQAGDGSCPAGTDTNALSKADLGFDFVDASGFTLLTASAAAIGLPESLTGVLMSPAGNCYVRVFEADVPTQSQLYKVTVTATSTPTVTASDGTFTDKVALSYTSIPNVSLYQILRSTTNDVLTAAPIGTSATSTFDDTTAVPLTTYFYWVNAAQGSATQRLATPAANSGFRAQPANPPGPFNLSSPADGSSDVLLTPTLSWTASANANTYTVVIDDTADLSSPISTVPGIAGTSYNVPGGVLANCSTYFWGVTAVNGVGSTGSTPTANSFSTLIPADFNHDGFVNGDDFDAYVAAFEAGDASADFNNDGFVNGDDFDTYVAAFEAGC